MITASEHGLIMEANRPFEVGATVALGFHLNRKDRSSKFVSAETVVVDSTPRFTERGKLVHCVTMVFSEISDRDRRLLVKLSRLDSLRAKEDTPEPSAPTLAKKAYDIIKSAPRTSFGFSLN